MTDFMGSMFGGLKIVTSPYMPEIGHRFTIPAFKCRGDYRRVKRWARMLKNTATPIHNAYVMADKFIVHPNDLEVIKLELI